MASSNESHRRHKASEQAGRQADGDDDGFISGSNRAALAQAGHWCCAPSLPEFNWLDAPMSAADAGTRKVCFVFVAVVGRS